MALGDYKCINTGPGAKAEGAGGSPGKGSMGQRGEGFCWALFQNIPQREEKAPPLPRLSESSFISTQACQQMQVYTGRRLRPLESVTGVHTAN